MRRPVSALAVTTVLAMTAAVLQHCGGSSSSPPTHACTPGASVACTGPGACSGFQVCKSDGSGFETCQCGTSPDAGSEGGATNVFNATMTDGGPDLDAGGGPGADDGTLMDQVDASFVTIEAGGDGACTGLGCMVPSGCTTTLSGVVYDPAGRNPIYGAYVFVPTDPQGMLSPITPGTRSCNLCTQSIGSYVAATVTDASGHFSLAGVPATTHVPLVAQIGKWRREISISQVTACMDNPVPAGSLRLPRSRAEGDLPQMALLTGGCDDLGCFLRGIGIDSGEFTAPHAGGRIDVYQGGGLAGTGGPGLTGGTAGDCTKSSCPLWSSRTTLEAYDVVLLACECAVASNAPPTAVTAMHDWVTEGGRVLATHFHYTWFMNGPTDFQGVATWLGSSTAASAGTYSLDTSFPRGAAMEQWLGLDGGIALSGVGESVSTVASTTRRWIYDPNASPVETKALSFETPVGAGPYCGKAVFSDMHAGTTPSGDVPGSCSGASLTEEQKALEFLLFDLSACVSDDTKAPPPPP